MIGESLGPYRIVELLESGGMSTVYRADDTRHHRPVAVKVMLPELAASLEASRFLREIETTARLVHPHIVPLHDSGIVHGLPYYVMPLVIGESLRARLVRERQLPITDAVHVAQQVADALGYAHAQGVVHRDLKPENILLSGGHALVADFGIARALSDVDLDSLTRGGIILGTPTYMSPEQASGVGLDGRSDLYSLGCVLYEMLTGRPPFTGRTAPIVLSQHLTSPPPRIQSLRPAVSDVIARAVERALEKVPGDRIPTAEQFAEALRDSGADSGADADSGVTRGAPHNLQQQVTTFVGRAHEVAECRKLLEATRLLTLTGVGGCGKTRLALQVASESLPHYPGGVWFVDLAPLSDPGRVTYAVATVLAVREQLDRSLLETLVGALRDKSLLLMLDNCEHVIGSCAELTIALLSRCTQLKVLATSREGINVAGEQVYPVPSLSIPTEQVHDARTAERFDSIRLFVDRARSVSPQFALNGNSATVAEICRQLDGIPLAIELAAARVRVLSVEQIRSKLEDRFRLLTGGERGVLPRQQTLHATLQWSFDLLAERERRLFRELSVFAGGWSLEAACEVCPGGLDDFDVLDVLSHLVDKSLVVVDRLKGGQPRYRFLDSVRAYASERLGDGRDIRDRHLEYFTSLAESEAAKLEGSEQLEWLSRLEDEHENLLTAVAWSRVAEEGAERALRLAGSIWRFWNIRGEYRLGRAVLDELLSRPDAGRHTTARAKALYGAAGLAVYQGDYDSARARFEECLAISLELDDAPCTARALNGLGFLAIERQDHVAGRELFERSLETHRKSGDVRGMAVAIANLGILSTRRGDFAEARAFHERSLACFREAGDRYALAMSLATLSVLALRAEDPSNACAFLTECLRLVRSLSTKRAAAHALEAAAELAVARGDVRSAARFDGAAAAVRERSGMPLDRYDAPQQADRIDRTRAALGEEAFVREWDESHAARFDAILVEASQWLDRIEPADPGHG